MLQGHCYRSRTGKLERYFKPDWLVNDQIPTQPADLPAIKVRRAHEHAPYLVVVRASLLRSYISLL